MDNSTGEAQKEAEVANQLNQLDNTIAEIGASINSLEARLSSVLKATVQPPTESKEPVEESLVPLAEILRTYNNRLLGHTRHLQSLYRDCEL